MNFKFMLKILTTDIVTILYIKYLTHKYIYKYIYKKYIKNTTTTSTSKINTSLIINKKKC